MTGDRHHDRSPGEEILAARAMTTATLLEELQQHHRHVCCREMSRRQSRRDRYTSGPRWEKSLGGPDQNALISQLNGLNIVSWVAHLDKERPQELRKSHNPRNTLHPQQRLRYRVLLRERSKLRRSANVHERGPENVPRRPRRS